MIRPHTCPCPAPYEYDYLEDGTLWQCPECRQWWVGREIRYTPGDRVVWARGTVDWHPVTRWNRKLLKQIRKAENV